MLMSLGMEMRIYGQLDGHKIKWVGARGDLIIGIEEEEGLLS